VILHRPLPNGFKLKTCTIVHKADGWYCCISMEDKTVPDPLPLDEVKSPVGVDVGLKEFLTTSMGETVPRQQTYRKAQRHLARQQKGSKNAEKQKNRIARVHQRLGRIRKDFHYNTAHHLVKNHDFIAVEDLDAVAVKCGIRVVKVTPHGTSVDCSNCGAKVPKTLSIRLHQCHRCGLEMDRDENAALNILMRALNAVGLIVSACGGQENTQPLKQEAECWSAIISVLTLEAPVIATA